MIDNPALEAILTTDTEISMVAEFYASNATPTDDGFDPHDALACYAAVEGITFQEQTYQRLITNFGRISKTIGKEVNSASITFSNVTREIADFEFTTGFEGLIMVIRVLSRSQSVDLTDTKIEFVGRCDKPASGSKESLTVSAKFILGSLDVTIPRRKFGPNDMEGRAVSDPEFEGFVFIPQYGTTTYTRREKQGGFLGWWNKKWVTRTLQYSSYSDLDSNKPVPELLGRGQIEGVHVGYDDVGGFIRMVTAFCEGEIRNTDNYQNIRSIDQELPLDSLMTGHYGKVGVLNGDGPGWVANGYYSRTAVIRLRANNSPVDVVDPAPRVVAVMFGRIMPIPTAGVWGGTEWTDNAAAHTRFLLTSEDYYKLDENWIDDDTFTEGYDFNAELIFNTEIADFTFVDEG
jgi:hypothetical protein